MSKDVTMTGEMVVNSDDIKSYKDRLLACTSLEAARTEFRNLLNQVVAESSKVFEISTRAYPTQLGPRCQGIASTDRRTFPVPEHIRPANRCL